MINAAGNILPGVRDLNEATRPLTIIDHGNKLAFLGCNYAGTSRRLGFRYTPRFGPL